MAGLARGRDLEDALRRLRSTDLDVQNRAIKELGQNPKATMALIELLGQPNERVARAAHRAFVRHLWDQEDRLALLLVAIDRLMRSDDLLLRRRLPRVLWAFGTVPRSLRKTLASLLNDEDRLVRTEAAATLWSIHAGSSRATRILESGLEPVGTVAFEAALRGLRAVGSAAAGARVTLRKLLSKTKGRMRISVARTFVAVGGDPQAVVPIYIAALRSPNRKRVARAVPAARETGIALLGPVLALSRVGNARVRRNAAWALADYGIRTPSAGRRLKALTLDTNSIVTRAAAGRTKPPVDDAILRKQYGSAWAFGGGFGISADARAYMRSVSADGRAWLARHQEQDGRWSAAGFGRHDPEGDRCFGGGRATADVRVTAMALLTFLGVGYTDRKNPHASTVRRALRFLIAQQVENGRIGARSGATPVGHAVATLALSEAFWLTGNRRYRKPMTLAAAALIRELKRPDANARVRSYGVLALQSCRFATLKFDGRVFESVGEWARAPAHRKERVAAAASLVCRVFGNLEDPRKAPLRDLVRGIRSPAPSWQLDAEHVDLDRLYFATLVLHQAQGKVWEAWHPFLWSTLPEVQHPKESGPLAGSWDPVGAVGAELGRVYSTAVATLCLQVFYRVDPFREKKDRSKKKEPAKR